MRSVFPPSREARLTLVTGGTRSGKSRFAVQLAAGFGRRIVYLATCQPSDQEMRHRIACHRKERPAQWKTIEPPADPAEVLAHLDGKADGLILDCLTMYVAQLVVAGRSDARIEQAVRRLCLVAHRAGPPVILVTNEVGAGLVPEYPMGRRFRDLAGRANQIAAALAEAVYLLVAGIPVLIKPPATAHRSRHASRSTR